MNSVVLSTHTAALFAEAVERAAALLRAGQLVALPTETVYGLAANAWDAAAVARIYEVKGRPARNPIIVHVAGLELARECVADWPPVAGRLAKAFWPGPLTLVLPRSPRVPDVVTAGGPTVGVRWPSHPFIQAVIRACGFPLAAPSANPASQVSPTHAAHVRKAFDGKIPLIVDGGPSQVGLESTVLDLAAAPPCPVASGHDPRRIVAGGDGCRERWACPREIGRRVPAPFCAVRVCCPNTIRPKRNWSSCRGATRRICPPNSGRCHFIRKKSALSPTARSGCPATMAEWPFSPTTPPPSPAPFTPNSTNATSPARPSSWWKRRRRTAPGAPSPTASPAPRNKCLARHPRIERARKVLFIVFSRRKTFLRLLIGVFSPS